MYRARPEAADTIVAVATPTGRGPLGMVRFSGSRATVLARCLFRPWKSLENFPPRRLAVSGSALVANGAGPEAIDQGVLVFYPAMESPTGEDLVEITLHGSPVVLDQVLAAATGHGARPALPGEFSYRAYLNGRLDAVQAEAIDDLIKARTVQQARAAHRQLTGGLSRALEEPRQVLVDALARLEGSIEFADTETEEFVQPASLRISLNAARHQFQELLASAQRGILLQKGSRIVLAGAVNAGKSSLFNSLCGSSRAIVDPQPGTTRDFIEAATEWDGLLVTLIDTAGERISGELDAVEKEGQRRSARLQEEADLVLWLLDGSSPQVAGPPPQTQGEPPRLLVVTKSDLGAPRDPSGIERLVGTSPWLAVSARTGTGLDSLQRKVMDMIAPDWERKEPPLVTRLRQQTCLTAALSQLDEALDLLGTGAGEELVVFPLGRCLTELAELTGRGDLDEVYDRIFSSFCIGK